MTFPQVMREVQIGRKVQRESWPDPRVWIEFKGGYLSIRKIVDDRETFQPLLITEGDLFSDDWIIVDDEASGEDRPN